MFKIIDDDENKPAMVYDGITVECYGDSVKLGIEDSSCLEPSNIILLLQPFTARMAGQALIEYANKLDNPRPKP